ncbi:MAG: Cys-tRNA(Pro) deacylase [Arachnia propionica]|nr:MAG: Cys-tRNA(Pro) deacylase [Arachnia propionica]
MGRKQAGATPGLRLLAASKVAHRVLEYDYDPQDGAIGLAAAEKLGIEPTRIFKTLILKVADQLVVAVVPVSGNVDLKAVATLCGQKHAELAAAATVERSTGMTVGGISPLGQRRRLPTIIDQSAVAHSLIVVSAGRRGLQVELSPQDLAQLSAAEFGAITVPGQR